MVGKLIVMALWGSSCLWGIDSQNALERLENGQESVREFRFLKQKLKEMQVAGWLFGGTAYTFGRYALSPSLNSQERSIAEIYHPTQDLDIVIDGTEVQALELETWLVMNFPSFLPAVLGGKSRWEVRLLRSDREHKISLFENPQFIGIHSDSGSTGLIQLFHPNKSLNSVTRDLHHWDVENDSPFFQSIKQNELYYYYSETHTDTKRFEKGKNPEVFSVIRYLTKLFQEEARPDLDSIRRYFLPIISDFTTETNLHPEYGIDRLRRLIAKMYLQAFHLENAVDSTKMLGLTKKLRDRFPEGTPGSIGWWVTQKPLVHLPVSEGGSSDEQVFYLRVDEHWEFMRLVYHNHGRLNVFSKKFDEGIEGVMAFAAPQSQGAFQFPVKFKLKSGSREGIDYHQVAGGIIVTNGAVVSILPPDWQMPIEQMVMQRAHRYSELGVINESKSYLSKNAEQILVWIGEDLQSLPANLVLCEYAKGLMGALNSNQISPRDFRRLLARIIGLGYGYPQFLEEFSLVVRKNIEIGHVFRERRGVFVNSNQHDSSKVRMAFLELEKKLPDCAVILSGERR